MATIKEFLSRIRLTYRRTNNVTKMAVAAAIVACMVTLIVLGVSIQTLRSRTEDLRQKAGILEEAEAVHTRALDGENFDDLIVEFGDDTGMMTQSQREEGYLVCRDSIDYVEEFKAGALTLTENGQISDLVLSDFGYHVIYAIEVYEEETVSFDEISEELADEMLEMQRGVAFTRAIEAVYEETDVEVYYKRLLRGNINTIGYDNALLVEESRFVEE